MSTITLALTSSTLTATGAPMSVTASVTNSAAVPARVVLGVFGAPGAPETGPRAWAQVDRPLRVIAPGTTEQYTVTVTPPAGTAAGDYMVRLIAYDADRPPEEYSDQAQQLQVVVPATPPPAPKGVPWWIYAVAAALVLVIGVVAFLMLRPAPAPPPRPSPTPSSPPPPSATPAPNPCAAPFVPRLSRPGDLTCVTPLSAAEARAENDPELQRLRKDPSGPYGPETCVQGYVWREAYPDDLVCVTPATRERTYWENQGHPEGTP